MCHFISIAFTRPPPLPPPHWILTHSSPERASFTPEGLELRQDIVAAEASTTVRVPYFILESFFFYKTCSLGCLMLT